jgi:hypothetical protein
MALTKVQSGLLVGGSGLNLSDSAPANTLVTSSAGNVGIGTASPLEKLDVRSANVSFGSTSGTDGNIYVQSGYDAGIRYLTRLRTDFNGFFSISTGSGSNTVAPSSNTVTERMRIDSSGGLLVGCTGGAGSAGVSRFYTDTSGDSMKIFNVQGSSSGITLLSAFSNASNPASPSGTIRFNLVTNGGIQNYSANNVNLSDIREKTDIELADNYLDKICSIPVKTFNYIDQNMDDDQGKTLGVIAQDVQEVAPELIKESNWGTKEEPKMRLSIYQTDLQYALMKCIQEQQAIITDLKARIETLEAK